MMEQIIIALEKFGLPVVMLGAVLWGIARMFNFLANDMMHQMKMNSERFEGIVIKLIDRSREDQEKVVSALNANSEQNRQQFEAILNQIATQVNMIVKLTGNGLKRE